MKIKYLATGVISFWLFAIFYSTITISERQFESGQLVSDVGSRILLLIAAPLLLLSGVLVFVRHRRMIVYLAKSYKSFLFFVAMFALMLFNGAILLNANAILYALLFGTSALVLLYVNSNCGVRFFLVAAISVVGMMLSFIVVHGLPVERWIGRIHPNHVGAFALLATFFAARSEHLLRWMIYLVAMSFVILVSSRYAMIAIAMIVFADYLAGMQRLNVPGALGIVLLSAILYFVILFGHEIVSEWLALHDSARGLDSGFTGRIDMWNNFVPQILERPIMGFGFRQRDLYYGTHNGFLNFALENGVIVTALFLLAIMLVIKEGISQFFRVGARKRDIIIIVVSWVAWAFSGFFQPQLVNFGDATGVMTVFLLTAHVRWITMHKEQRPVGGRSHKRGAYA